MNILRATNDFNDFFPDTFSDSHIQVRMALKNNIYLLSNGDLGAAFELQGIADEPMIPDELAQNLHNFKKAMTQIVSGIPSSAPIPNCQIQILAQQRRVSPKAEYSSDAELTLADSILTREQDFLHRNSPLSTRKFFIFVRYTPVKEEEKSLFQTALHLFKKSSLSEESKDEDSLYDDYMTFVEHLKGFSISLGDHVVEPVDYRGLSRILRVSMNGDIGTTPLNPNPFDLSSNLEFEFDRTDDGRILTKNGISRTVYFAESICGSFGNGMFRHFMDNIPSENWDICWHVSSGTREPSNRIKVASKLYKEERYPDEHREYRLFTKKVSSQNPQVSLAMKLVVFDEPSDFETKIRNVALDHLGALYIKERHVPLHQFLTSLPMNSPPRSIELKGRFHFACLSDALMYLPIYTSGSTTGRYDFQSRQDLACRFDLFKGNEINKNTAIIGIPGAGKSTMIGLMCLNFMASNPDGIIRIVDFGSSFRKLCDLFGGRYIDFTPDYLRENIFSPFALTKWDEEEIQTIKHFICTIVEAKNPDATWQTIHDQILINSIKIAFNRYRRELDESDGGKLFSVDHPKWDEIKTNFSQTTADYTEGGYDGFDEAVAEISKWTMAFDESGEYDFVFNAVEDLSKASAEEVPKIVVYNLGGIGSDPVLRVMAAMLTNMRILKDVGRDPKSKKLVFNDELGTQIKGSKDGPAKISQSATQRQAEAITTMYATARKLNVQNVVATPSAADYTEIPAGKVIWSLCTQYLFFGMGGMVNDSLKEHWKFLNEADWSIISDLAIDIPNKRTSCYLISNTAKHKLKSSLYVPLSPLMDAILTTNRSSLVHYVAEVKKGKTPYEVCAEMAKNHPYGEGI